jgi:CRISPR-associated protein Cas5h
MKRQAIKFKLSGDYALFKKPFANNQPQSFVIPPKTAILGMVGAIMGWGKEEYLKNLPFDKFSYAVRLLTPKIKKDLIGINLMQGKDADFNMTNPFLKPPKSRGKIQSPRSPTRFEFLKDMKWEIFLLLESQLGGVQDELVQRLKEKKFVYNPNLGLQSLFAKIDVDNKVTVDLTDIIELPQEEIGDDLYTSFDKNKVKFTINKPVTFYNELIPVSFNDDRSLPVTKEMISFVGDYSLKITNKDELKEKFYADDDRRLYQFI